MVGMVLGFLRMIIDFSYMAPPCGVEDTRPSIVKDFHYMYFAMSLFFLVGIVAVVVSLLTDQLPHYRLIRTTFWTRKVTDRRPDEKDDFRDSTSKSEAASELVNNIEMEYIIRAKNEKEILKQSQPKSFFSSVVSSVFGLADLGDTQKVKETEMNEAQRRADTFDSLNQTKWEKIILNTNLVFICSIAVTLFIVFSLPDEHSIWR